jgi:FtsP/CotA-like multicopper oxidase with cupredoxin domain
VCRRTTQIQRRPANCVVLPAGKVVRRRITFSNPADNDFELKSEVVTADGTSIDSDHTIGPQQLPHDAMSAPRSVLHVCPRFGEQEVWELVNETGELHNFHIHQSKLRLSVPSDPGVPQGSLAPQDPTGIIAQYVPEAQAATPDAGVDVWHDTIPVPPASFNGTNMIVPGRRFVTIPFHAREQIGFFVFHCHILEHEDGGMMAVIQVFDPAHPNQSNNYMPDNSMGMPHHSVWRADASN